MDDSRIDMQREVERLRQTPIAPEEREFVLSLIRDARVHGILEIEYKALRIRISPAAAERAQAQTYFTSTSGQPMGWSTKLPIAGARP